MLLAGLRVILSAGLGSVCCVGMGVELSTGADVVFRLGGHTGVRDIWPRVGAVLSEGSVAGRTAHKLLGFSPVVERVVHRAPLALEGESRVQHCQEAAGKDDHDTL